MGELRILIVDDNEASAKTIGWTMEFLKYDAKIALDGTSALELARTYKPNLVLLDIGLPDMSGYEVCEQMRMMPELKDTILVAQTGWDQNEHRVKAQQAGFHYHWVKPLEFSKLGDMLGKIVQDHHLAA